MNPGCTILQSQYPIFFFCFQASRLRRILDGVVAPSSPCRRRFRRSANRGHGERGEKSRPSKDVRRNSIRTGRVKKRWQQSRVIRIFVRNGHESVGKLFPRMVHGSGKPFAATLHLNHGLFSTTSHSRNLVLTNYTVSSASAKKGHPDWTILWLPSGWQEQRENHDWIWLEWNWDLKLKKYQGGIWNSSIVSRSLKGEPL